MKDLGVKKAQLGASVTSSSVKGLRIRLSDRAGNQTQWIAAKNGVAKGSTVRSIATGTQVASTVLALTAKMRIPKGSRITMRVEPSSRKVCRVAGNSLRGSKSGTCRVSISIRASKQKTQTKSLSLRVTK
jgi:hypothetical protein